MWCPQRYVWKPAVAATVAKSGATNTSNWRPALFTKPWQRQGRCHGFVNNAGRTSVTHGDNNGWNWPVTPCCDCDGLWCLPNYTGSRVLSRISGPRYMWPLSLAIGRQGMPPAIATGLVISNCHNCHAYIIKSSLHCTLWSVHMTLCLIELRCNVCEVYSVKIECLLICCPLVTTCE